MKLKAIFALAAGLSIGAAASVGYDDEVGHLVKRSSTDDLRAFKGALLIKNGQQTTCEVALMHGTYGFVSANCLDYTNKDGKSVDMNTSYDVVISAGLDGAYGSFKVTKLVPNPRYDPKSYANNIAIVFFENGGRPDFKNYIASWRPDWTNLYYVRRTMFNVNTGGWNMPVSTAYNSSADLSECSRASKVFASNQDDFFCNQLSVPSIFNSTCVVPYGSIYGVNSVNLAIAALYSHSAIYSQDEAFCGQSKIFNYYTVLRNYMHWAMKVVSEPAPVFHTKAPEYSENKNPDYSMTIPNPANTDSVSVYGGDIYSIKLHAETVPAPTVSEMTTLASSNGLATPTGSSQASTLANGDKEEKELSTGVIAGIIVGVLALLAALAYFTRRKLRKSNINLTSRVLNWLNFSGKNTDNYSERPPSYVTRYEMTHMGNHSDFGKNIPSSNGPYFDNRYQANNNGW
ncbi:hypothetical protein GGI07_003707 [Coemansia sp. Benny D115]|nr:hypothetical protein GGI07_003707 [Coemansia sp. Benny D115]